MAILYGTTSDGDTLPCQVNAAGQLVAQGLQGEKGDKGDQGEQGEQGPVGNVEFTSGEWTPTFASTDEEAAGFFEYQYQDGFWWRYGPLLTIVGRISTTAVTLTNARGSLVIDGLPPEAHLAVPDVSAQWEPNHIGMCIFSGQAVVQRPALYWVGSKRWFVLKETGVYPAETMQYSILDGLESHKNEVRFSFQGLADDAVRSVAVPLDEVM